MFAKQPQFSSEAWRRAVASLPCALCMRTGHTQAAHPNHRGKAMGKKLVPDCWCVPLCTVCHADFDQGSTFTKQQKRELMDEWIIQTILQLASAGLIKA